MEIFQLNDDLVAAMRLAEEPLDRLARESIVLEPYRRMLISSEEASSLLGMQRFDFVHFASRHGVLEVGKTVAEGETEMQTIGELKIPVRHVSEDKHAQAWAALKELSVAIGKRIEGEVSAVEMVRDVRRDL